MVRFRRATVVRVVAERPGAVELEVEIAGARATGIVYPELSGPIAPGVEVLVNATAVELGLGTGGVHFVVAVLPDGEPDAASPLRGRVMKARYTPLQTLVQ